MSVLGILMTCAALRRVAPVFLCWSPVSWPWGCRSAGADLPRFRFVTSDDLPRGLKSVGMSFGDHGLRSPNGLSAENCALPTSPMVTKRKANRKTPRAGLAHGHQTQSRLIRTLSLRGWAPERKVRHHPRAGPRPRPGLRTSHETAITYQHNPSSRESAILAFCRCELLEGDTSGNLNIWYIEY